MHLGFRYQLVVSSKWSSSARWASAVSKVTIQPFLHQITQAPFCDQINDLYPFRVQEWIPMCPKYAMSAYWSASKPLDIWSVPTPKLQGEGECVTYCGQHSAAVSLLTVYHSLCKNIFACPPTASVLMRIEWRAACISKNSTGKSVWKTADITSSSSCLKVMAGLFKSCFLFALPKDVQYLFEGAWC